jgi:nitrogenase molybdenum-iron protein alpha/beta subunit
MISEMEREVPVAGGIPLADLKSRLRGLRQSAKEEHKAAGRRFYSAVCDLLGYARDRIAREADERLAAGEDPEAVEADRAAAMRSRSKTTAHKAALADKTAECYAADRRHVMYLTELCEEVGGVRPGQDGRELSVSEMIEALERSILAVAS